MTGEILRELNLDELAADIRDRHRPVVFLSAPNFEDRSVASAEWFLETLRGRRSGIGVHVVWLQTPGVDDIFDRIKADNRDFVAGLFRNLDARSVIKTRVDLPASDTRHVFEKTQDLARKVGNNATIVLDISSLPRVVVRHLFENLVRDRGVGSRKSPAESAGRVICLYTAAAEYPVGADSDILGGVEGYFTKKRLHELIDSAGILESVVSLAGTAHDAAQTLDALWSHGSSARTTISAIVYLNRDNFLYSYQRLARSTWALRRAADQNTPLLYAFELQDVLHKIFTLTEHAIERHIHYRVNGGGGIPTLLIGGFGPKPIGLAALLARMRYQRALELEGHPSTSDVLDFTGWQYTTRYSHGTGTLKAFEVSVSELFRFCS